MCSAATKLTVLLGQISQHHARLRQLQITVFQYRHFAHDVALLAPIGVTRGTVFDIAKEQGIPIREADLMRYDIWCADECFLTGTGAEVIPVVKLDGRVIGTGQPGPVTAKVLENFRRKVLVEGVRI